MYAICRTDNNYWRHYRASPKLGIDELKLQDDYLTFSKAFKRTEFLNVKKLRKLEGSYYKKALIAFSVGLYSKGVTYKRSVVTISDVASQAGGMMGLLFTGGAILYSFFGSYLHGITLAENIYKEQDKEFSFSRTFKF